MCLCRFEYLLHAGGDAKRHNKPIDRFVSTSTASNIIQIRHHSLSATKEYAHNESMREPDLDTVDDAITSPFDDGQVVMKLRLGYERLDGSERHNVR